MTVVVKGSARVRIYAPTGRMLADVTPPAGSVFTAYYGVTWSPDGEAPRDWTPLALEWSR